MNTLSQFASIWLIISALLLLGYWTSWIPFWQAGIYGFCVCLFSLLSFISNGLDKFFAARELQRLPEKWLHLLELCGGWPGAHWGQQLFRHKTIKPSYRRIFWLMVIIHLLLVGLAVYFSLDPGDTAAVSGLSFKVGSIVYG